MLCETFCFAGLLCSLWLHLKVAKGSSLFGTCCPEERMTLPESFLAYILQSHQQIISTFCYKSLLRKITCVEQPGKTIF